MKLKYFLCLFLSVASFKQIAFSSQEQQRTEIYDNIAAMLRAEYDYSIGVVTVNQKRLLATSDNVHIDFFTTTEAEQLVAQSSIARDDQRAKIISLLTSGDVDIPDRNTSGMLGIQTDKTCNDQLILELYYSAVSHGLKQERIDRNQ